jgi:hypothetical protein
MSERKLTKEQRDEARRIVGHCGYTCDYLPVHTANALIHDIDAADAEIRRLNEGIKIIDFDRHAYKAEAERLREENERLKKCIRLAGDYSRRLGEATTSAEMKRIFTEYKSAMDALKEG